MATSLLSPLTAPNPEAVGSGIGVSKSSFLPSTKLLSLNLKPHPRKPTTLGCYKSPLAKSLDHIPKQFREENLKDGLMDNFKNVPKSLYGLSPKQMDMFMTEDNPFRRQSESLTEESISSARNYLDHNGGMWSMSGTGDRDPSRYSMSVSMYRGGGRGYGRRSAPPDLPSLLLDSRIVYLGMPIVPAVTELLVAQFIYLDFDDTTKPIYLYINSPGTQNMKRENVGSETDAFAISDSMGFCKSKVYTINLGMAYGQAAMLLSLGAKGYRGVQPNSSVMLYLPQVYRSSGAATDTWIKAKELESNADSYCELLAKGTGKTKEEIREDLQTTKVFFAEQAIEYGLADRILYSLDGSYEPKDYDALLAKRKTMRKPGGPEAADSGFRFRS
ncbi:ClpP [Corchorus capsularis]|uniref:ATP-dependent Clp protease proteolytic subunit n=1 Tax=Corchorus capsularis TaxID=210143 RepID=A0A1R3HU22_COCAP|nr:ClpP [Corchorus capsularis]